MMKQKIKLSAPTSKTLILVRHAHRDTSDREADNGLSSRGWEQARAIACYYFSHGRLSGHPALVASPKQRCVQTLEPLCEKLREAGDPCEIRRMDLLVEGGFTESSSDLVKRVAEFQAWWVEQAPELTIACSHGDWIPVFCDRAIRKSIELSKGGWLRFSLSQGKIELLELRQKLPEE